MTSYTAFVGESALCRIIFHTWSSIHHVLFVRAACDSNRVKSDDVIFKTQVFLLITHSFLYSRKSYILFAVCE